MINVPNAEGNDIIRPYSAAKFDPEDPTGSTLILPVLFLYPEYATSDMISDFVEDTSFAAIFVVVFPPSAAVGRRGYICGCVARRVCDDKAEEAVESRTGDDAEERCRASGSGSGAVGPNGKGRLEVKDGCLSFVALPKGDWPDGPV